MPLIHLQGRLICATPEERRVVLAQLPLHIRLTLREPGCLFFDIAQDPFDPMVWQVNEGFANRAAFEAHQARTQASEWSRASQGIARDYPAPVEVEPEIVPETHADARALYLLNRLAFGGTAEAQLVDALRKAGALAASVVARFNRAYLGHVAFSPLEAPFSAWALAPLAVRDCVRRQGIAEALVRAGIARARAQGVQAIFVLGDPAYYGRFGFSAAEAKGYHAPWMGPQFQMLNLSGAALPKGPLAYAAPFDALIATEAEAAPAAHRT